MQPKHIGILFIAMSAFCVGLPAARATPVNYGDFIGSGPGEVDFLQVTEDSLTPAHPTPLFGAPIRAGNQLLFFPTTFAAYAANGGFDSAAGTLSMTVVADAGYYLQTITLNDVGDCTMLGFGGFDTWVDIIGLLSATDIAPGTHGAFADVPQIVPPLGTLTSPAFAIFDGAAVIDLTGLGISAITLASSNILQASSELGTTAFIQKKVFGLSVTTVPIPEPASALGLACGLLTLLTRRRYSARL